MAFKLKEGGMKSMLWVVNLALAVTFYAVFISKRADKEEN